nr:hypothetical protein CFP56_24161 [Quercus suber]
MVIVRFDDEVNVDFENNVARRNVPQENVRAQITRGHRGCPCVRHVDVKALEENKPTINERSCVVWDKKGSALLCEFGMNVICLVENVRWVNRICTNYLCPAYHELEHEA